VLYCVLKLCAWMSSSYSSLDWVLSHLCHFTVRRFICVCVFMYLVFHTALYMSYYCEHGGVDLVGLKPNPLDLSSFSGLTLLVGSFDA